MSFKDPANLSSNGNNKKRKIKYWSFLQYCFEKKKTVIKSEQSQQYTLRRARFFFSLVLLEK